ncbi:MAG TPA: hypothetical protein VH592_08215, partial [Gemmataceae bacterium]
WPNRWGRTPGATTTQSPEGRPFLLDKLFQERTSRPKGASRSPRRAETEPPEQVGKAGFQVLKYGVLCIVDGLGLWAILKDDVAILEEFVLPAVEEPGQCRVGRRS